MESRAAQCGVENMGARTMPAKRKEKTRIASLPDMDDRRRRLNEQIRQGAETMVPKDLDVTGRIISGLQSEFRKLGRRLDFAIERGRIGL
jgi:hypothetical protein